MARFLALEFISDQKLRTQAAVVFSFLVLMSLMGQASRAQSMMQSSPPTEPTSGSPAVAKTPPPSSAPVSTPVTNGKPPAPPAISAPVVPPPVPDTFNRYGKIWAPSDDVMHPIKLNVQFPGVGEMKIPSQDELSVRDKLEKLATLSDDQIRTELAQWPPYAKMKLADEGQLLIRIQQFKDQRTRIAMDKARELGLVNSLTPDQKVRFEKEYWDKKLQMDHDLAKQFEPALKAREQKLREDLFREFSTPGTAVPAPPTVAAAAKPAPATSSPATPPTPSTPPAKPPIIPPIAEGKPAPEVTPPVVH